MGFNIAGLVIDENYQDRLPELETLLGDKLIFQKEVLFEDASENWKEDNYCDIYFSEKGTFIFISGERAASEYALPKSNLFTFILSEMTMTFMIDFVEKGISKRSLVDVEGEIIESEGEPLPIESKAEDASEIIYLLIEDTIGESFDDIDLEATCYRFAFESSQQEQEQEQEQEGKLVYTSAKESKPWWKFW